MNLLSFLKSLQDLFYQTHTALQRRTLFKLSVATLLSFVLPNRINAHPARLIGTDLPATTPPIQPLFNLLNFPDTVTLSTGEVLKRDPTRMLLFLKGPIQGNDAFASKLGSAGFLTEPSSKAARVNHTPTRVFVRSVNGQAITQDMVNQFARALRRIGPIYLMPSGEGPRDLYCVLPHILVVRPKAGITDMQLSKSLAFLQLQEFQGISTYLAGYRYLVLNDLAAQSIFAIYRRLVTQEKHLVDRVLFDFMPLIVPTGASSNDPYYEPAMGSPGFPGQWNLQKIKAANAWDIATGAGVIVSVVDSGCDFHHRDLTDLSGNLQGVTFSFPPNEDAMPDIDDTTRDPTVGSNGLPDNYDFHGTQVAGVLAARLNNTNAAGNCCEGMAGMAPNCRLLPIKLENFTRTELIAALSYASDPTRGAAKVINLSYGERPESFVGGWKEFIDDVITRVVFRDRKVLLCSITQNSDERIVYYPGAHRYVMACGASNKGDFRSQQTNGDWVTYLGSNYGPGISVVAPGSHIISTTGATNAQATPNYLAPGYDKELEGTSLAAPLVSGLAVLLMSAYPSLKNDPTQVRNIIERTADKVHRNETPGYVYRVMPDLNADDNTLRYPNGTWNEQVGYGRINAYHALDLADVFIKDSLDDIGSEPSAGIFHETSDIVVRPSDDGVFEPGNFLSSLITPGRDNVLYVRVTNNGPAVARNVTVEARIVPFVATQFEFDDWIADNPTHLKPSPLTPGSTTFASISPGPAGAVIAKFMITEAQVSALMSFTGHPCLLAKAVCANDYAFVNVQPDAPGITVTRLNNLAQRNVSVVQVRSGKSVSFNFVAGNIQKMNTVAEILIERGWLHDIAVPLPHDAPAPLPLPRVLLALDDAHERFPHTHITGRVGEVLAVNGEMARTGFDDKLLGADRSRRRRSLEVEEKAMVRFESSPGKLLPLSLQISIPEDAMKGSRYRLRVLQKNEYGEVIGGATVIYLVE